MQILKTFMKTIRYNYSNKALLLLTSEELIVMPEIAKNFFLPEFIEEIPKVKPIEINLDVPIEKSKSKGTTEDQIKALREKTFARFNQLGEKGIIKKDIRNSRLDKSRIDDDLKLKRLSTLWDKLIVEKNDEQSLDPLHSEESIKLLLSSVIKKGKEEIEVPKKDDIAIVNVANHKTEDIKESPSMKRVASGRSSRRGSLDKSPIEDLKIDQHNSPRQRQTGIGKSPLDDLHDTLLKDRDEIRSRREQRGEGSSRDSSRARVSSNRTGSNDSIHRKERQLDLMGNIGDMLSTLDSEKVLGF
jgi:hypothetical protein